MRLLRFALNGLRREMLAGEMLVLTLALTIAVGSITAIAFLTDRITSAVQNQATEVLAADLRLSGGRALPAENLVRAEAAQLRTASTMNFPSVVFAGDARALVNLKSVSQGYPLRGELRTAERLFGEVSRASSIPLQGEAWADAALMARLGIDVGATVELGNLTLRVSRVLVYRPDQSPGFSGLAPTLLINIVDVPASGLIVEGSRVSYAQLFAGQRSTLDAFTASLRAEPVEGVRIEDRAQAGSQLSAAIDRASRFLALASLVSLILASVAVAMAARRYAERRLDYAALLKSFGASQRFIFQVSLVHVLVLGLLASVIGTSLGFVAERALSSVLSGWLRGDLPAANWQSALPGAVTALLLLAGFALPSLMRLRDTPPLRVLRHDLSPPPPGIWLTYGAAVLVLSALVFWAVRDLALLSVIVGGTLATALLLFFAGRVLVSLLGRMRAGVGVSWRYGLANVARRGSTSAIQVVAFGLGIMVLLLLTLVRNDLLAGWRATIDQDAPNQFLINIQPQERDSIRTLLAEEGWERVDFVPMIRGRVTAINDIAAADWNAAKGFGRSRVGREINLSYTATLDESNSVRSGTFWAADYAGDSQLSIDHDVAEEIGVVIGDTLTFDFAGQLLSARVTSTRDIQWESFKPNFFMVLSPAGMDQFAATFLTSLNVPATQTDVLLKLVRAHPSVSVIDIEAALEQVRSVIDKAALAVQYVFVFTLAAGIVVLFAAIQSTIDERRYEAALLRTFGASRRVVLTGIAAEFCALGLLAGVCAATGASVIGIIAARELFDLEIGIDPVLWLTGVLAGLLMVGVFGTLAAKSAADSPPVNTLRRY